MSYIKSIIILVLVLFPIVTAAPSAVEGFNSLPEDVKTSTQTLINWAFYFAYFVNVVAIVYYIVLIVLGNKGQNPQQQNAGMGGLVWTVLAGIVLSIGYSLITFLMYK
jgi:uncharacterized membrane protein